MGVPKTINFTLRVDAHVKEEAEKLFNDLGMSLSSALNIFLRQALIAQGLPFPVRRERENKTTLEAMREALRLVEDPTAKTYATLEELKREIDDA